MSSSFFFFFFPHTKKHLVTFWCSVQSAVWISAFQLKAKRSECNSKATHARNDYLLTLAAANAHQRRYYDTDLTDCIKVRTGRWMGREGRVTNPKTHLYLLSQVLNGRIYEQVKDYLVALCQTELDTYQAAHNMFDQLLNNSNGVRRLTGAPAPQRPEPGFLTAAD